MMPRQRQPYTGLGLAESICRQFHDTPSRTLARKLLADNPDAYANLESARHAVLTIRGQNGERDRVKSKARVPRAAQPPGWTLACPPSSAEKWEPLVITGPAKVLVLSDIHVPYHQQEAVQAAVKYGKRLKPDIVLLNGDVCDFYRLSRWQQDPKMRDLKFEIDTARELLSWIRGQFPKSRLIFKLGNHEERWDVYIWNRCVELWNLKNLQLHNVLGFEDFGIERVDDNPILCGKLPILHGHEAGKGVFSPVNPARGMFLRTNHTVLIGHLHRPSSHAEPNMFHDETMTWSTGCLCNLQPKYARINKWAHGFAHVDVQADGEFNVHNYRLSRDYQVRTA